MANSGATIERERGGRNGSSYQPYQQQRQQEQEDRNRIRGPWFRADESDNSAELAETDDPDVLGVRSSYDHSRMAFFTRSQIRNLARAADTDPHVRDLIRA